jgi:hypothetical protein
VIDARAAAAALAALLAAGCAAAPPPGHPAHPSALSAEDRNQIEAAEQVMRAKEDELAAARAGAAPDCARLELLAGNVCALAEKICTIAARYPPDDPVAARCTDARARCARSRDALRERCGVR